MRGNISTVFMVLLLVVMLGVVSGINVTSRNGILVKEVFYVAGGSIASMLAAVLLFLRKPCYRQRIPAVSLGAAVAVLFLMGLTHFTGIGSPNGPFTFLSLLSLVAQVVASLLFIDKAHIKLFVSVMIGATSLVFIYAVMQWQGVYIFDWDAALVRNERSSGSFGNPNLLGGFASAILPLAVAYFFSLKNRSRNTKIILTALFAALALTAIVASGTRGSLIGVVVGGGVFLLLLCRNMSKRFKKMVSVVFIVVVAAVTYPLLSRLAELDPAVEDHGTLQVRRIIWSGAFDLFADSPLIGHGPGSFQILFPSYRDPLYSSFGVSNNTLHAHCEYLEILGDIGVTGMLLWMVVLWGFAVRIRKVDLLSAGAFAGVAAVLAESIVSVQLRWPPGAWMFATLLMIFLSRADKPVQSDSKTIVGAVGMALVSLILATGFFVHYLPLYRSLGLSFKGKDIFLTQAETAMEDAHYALFQWAECRDRNLLDAAITQWQNASVLLDSAVVYSKQATEIYSDDPGGWYALGSAHLTRYMVMDPQMPLMSFAMEAAGFYGSSGMEEAKSELLQGMSAYDTLLTMAPNYAEVHNNRALGYSSLGMLDASMEEMYKAYKMHAHMRENYFNQTSAFFAVYPNSFYGALLLFHHTLNGFDPEASGRRLDGLYNSIIEQAWFLVSLQPERETILKEEFITLIGEILPVKDQDLLTKTVRHIEDFSPFSAWNDVLSFSDEVAINNLREMSISSGFASRTFPSMLPDHSDFYRCPASVLFRSNWDTEIFDAVMDIFFYQIVTDRNLDDANLLVNDDYFNSSVASDVAAKIQAVKMALGGSRAAMREGMEVPWLAGSLPALVSDSLHSRMEHDSLNSKWYRMELRMTFLLVTSYWWDQNIYAPGQNQYLLDRIFYCRDMTRKLEPERWSCMVSGITADEIDRIGFQTDYSCPATMELLRNDLLSGTRRAGD